ncbi:MAG: abortive phage resistance protein, partial [Burkholderiales bacterium]
MTRIGDDPEGAITAARTLVESVCKLILDHLSIAYENDGDLGRLFKITARSLNLAVDQHEEQVFKQILTGMGSVVSGFASLRNSLGDAHGKGKK